MEVRRGWQDQKPLIFMHFHGVSLGNQHEMWSKQHNGKVRFNLLRGRAWKLMTKIWFVYPLLSSVSNRLNPIDY